MKWGAYWRLMRFNKPAGILLLWYPMSWAFWSSNKGLPPLPLLVLSFIGTVCMRAAGCVFNDITDRHVDRHVARTKLRPLAASEISLFEAFAILIALLACSFWVLIQLPKNCFYIALLAVLITGFYPFCKRFFYAPQLVLGLAFSMGIPMAYLASLHSFDSMFYLLCFINFVWIVSYDTMYAMADREDDVRIGVQSTALFFAEYDRLVIALLLFILQGLWIYWALLTHALAWFYCFWFLGSGVLVYQHRLIYNRNRADCLKAFVVSIYYGAMMSIAVSLAF